MIKNVISWSNLLLYHYIHYLRIMFLIETMIFVSKYVLITMLIFKFSITAICLIVRTEVITIYDIINFNIEFCYWMIEVKVLDVELYVFYSESFHVYYHSMWQDSSRFYHIYSVIFPFSFEFQCHYLFMKFNLIIGK